MKNNIGRIISLLLIVSLILLPYGSYGMSYGSLAIVLALFVILASGRLKLFDHPKGFVVYFLYTLLIPPLCAAVTYGYVLEALREGRYKKVLIVATGALLNPVIVAQKETIPSIAHAIVLERVE